MPWDALRAQQEKLGASFDDRQVPATFPDDLGNQPLSILEHPGVYVFDRCHWGRISVLGNDRLRFLHNQTTNSFQGRSVGSGCHTTFVTATARTLDLASAYVLEDRVLLLVSPEHQGTLMTWLDRYLFPLDRVTLEDSTSHLACFTLVGTNTPQLLERLGLTDLPTEPYGHKSLTLGHHSVHLAQDTGLGVMGYTLWCEADQGEMVWSQLLGAGDGDLPVSPGGTQAWERWRLAVGRPAVGAELTEDYNPLEAGLWHTVSFNKGCYIGQETIARLNTYKGVKQRLWGVALAGSAVPGPLFNDTGEKVGRLTSVLGTEDGSQGLGYIRTKAGGPGIQVYTADQVVGTIVAKPFPQHPDESDDSQRDAGV